jgi:ABC-2 type transport system permease protein
MILMWLYRRYKTRRTAAQPATLATATRTPAKPAERGRIALVLHQSRYDLLGFSRNRQARFFTVLLPLLFLVIFVSVFGNELAGPQHVKSSTYYVPGLAAMSVIAASFVNLVITITAERESGVLKRRRATPVPAWVLIAGRAVTSVAVSLGVMTVVLLVGRIAYGVQLPASTIPGVTLTAIVGSISFCVLGYALASVVESEDSAQPMVQAVTLPLYFISGVFVPNVDLPAWLDNLGRLFPVQHLAGGLHNAFDPAARGSGIVGTDLVVLALWAAAGLAVALRRFRWTPVAAGA